MAIDVHAHFWTDDYLDKIAALGKNNTAAQRGQGAGDGAELDARLALMDRAGVGMQVLSASPQLPHGPDKAAAVDAARHVNDQYADLAARHPGRFAAFASLPLPHLDASRAELARALDGLGMVGVAMTSTILGQPLVDSPAAELFAELDRRGTVLYLHPAGNAACTPLIADHHATWSIGAPVEDTISALHLITHGIPSRYPRMKILNSHLGGALPMFLQRMDNQLPWEAPETPETPSVAARRMWYDTVGHGHPPALRCAADSLGTSRLVLGTDFPYQNGTAYQRAISYITTSGLPPAKPAACSPPTPRHSSASTAQPRIEPAKYQVRCPLRAQSRSHAFRGTACANRIAMSLANVRIIELSRSVPPTVHASGKSP